MQARLTGILGWPLGHTYSPIMHHSAFSYLGLPFIYLAFPVRPEELKDALQGIRILDFAGVNLTIPHKEPALSLMDRLDSSATMAGAINTVVNEEGCLVGYNTDIYGFGKALAEAGFEPSNKSIVILGAGGAARGAGALLATRGARRITWANRTEARAEALARNFQALYPESAFQAIPLITSALEAALSEAELLVNSTSIGLMNSAFDPPLPIQSLPGETLVLDLIYNPVQTPLLKDASDRGLKAINGSAMLLHQGARAFELWTGQPAPLQVMRQTLDSMNRS